MMMTEAESDPQVGTGETDMQIIQNRVGNIQQFLIKWTSYLSLSPVC